MPQLTGNPEPTPREPRSQRRLMLMLIGAVVLGGLVLTSLGLGTVLGRWSRAGLPAPAQSVTVIRHTPNVIVAVRDLAQLNSAEYHLERVIDLSEKQRLVFGLVEAEDAILLIAVGQVTAGCDLSQLGADDVIVDVERRSVRITLPPAKILTSRLDNEKTYVHRRSTDLLARRKDSLETRARQAAERSLVEAALEGGILVHAQKNAAHTVEALVRSLGYDEVVVTSKTSPDP